MFRYQDQGPHSFTTGQFSTNLQSFPWQQNEHMQSYGQLRFPEWSAKWKHLSNTNQTRTWSGTHSSNQRMPSVERTNQQYPLHGMKPYFNVKKFGKWSQSSNSGFSNSCTSSNKLSYKNFNTNNRKTTKQFGEHQNTRRGCKGPQNQNKYSVDGPLGLSGKRKQDAPKSPCVFVTVNCSNERENNALSKTVNCDTNMIHQNESKTIKQECENEKASSKKKSNTFVDSVSDTVGTIAEKQTPKRANISTKATFNTTNKDKSQINQVMTKEPVGLQNSCEQNAIGIGDAKHVSSENRSFKFPPESIVSRLSEQVKIKRSNGGSTSISVDDSDNTVDDVKLGNKPNTFSSVKAVNGGFSGATSCGKPVKARTNHIASEGRSSALLKNAQFTEAKGFKQSEPHAINRYNNCKEKAFCIEDQEHGLHDNKENLKSEMSNSEQNKHNDLFGINKEKGYGANVVYTNGSQEYKCSRWNRFDQNLSSSVDKVETLFEKQAENRLCRLNQLGREDYYRNRLEQGECTKPERLPFSPNQSINRLTSSKKVKFNDDVIAIEKDGAVSKKKIDDSKPYRLAISLFEKRRKRMKSKQKKINSKSDVNLKQKLAMESTELIKLEKSGPMFKGFRIPKHHNNKESVEDLKVKLDLAKTNAFENAKNVNVKHCREQKSTMNAKVLNTTGETKAETAKAANELLRAKENKVAEIGKPIKKRKLVQAGKVSSVSDKSKTLTKKRRKHPQEAEQMRFNDCSTSKSEETIKFCNKLAEKQFSKDELKNEVDKDMMECPNNLKSRKETNSKFQVKEKKHASKKALSIKNINMTAKSKKDLQEDRVKEKLRKLKNCLKPKFQRIKDLNEVRKVKRTARLTENDVKLALMAVVCKRDSTSDYIAKSMKERKKEQAAENTKQNAQHHTTAETKANRHVNNWRTEQTELEFSEYQTRKLKFSDISVGKASKDLEHKKLKSSKAPLSTDTTLKSKDIINDRKVQSEGKEKVREKIKIKTADHMRNQRLKPANLKMKDKTVVKAVKSIPKTEHKDVKVNSKAQMKTGDTNIKKTKTKSNEFLKDHFIEINSDLSKLEKEKNETRKTFKLNTKFDSSYQKRSNGKINPCTWKMNLLEKRSLGYTAPDVKRKMPPVKHSSHQNSHYAAKGVNEKHVVSKYGQIHSVSEIVGKKVSELRKKTESQTSNTLKHDTPVTSQYAVDINRNYCHKSRLDGDKVTSHLLIADTVERSKKCSKLDTVLNDLNPAKDEANNNSIGLPISVLNTRTQTVKTIETDEELINDCQITMPYEFSKDFSLPENNMWRSNVKISDRTALCAGSLQSDLGTFDSGSVCPTPEESSHTNQALSMSIGYPTEKIENESMHENNSSHQRKLNLTWEDIFPVPNHYFRLKNILEGFSTYTGEERYDAYTTNAQDGTSSAEQLPDTAHTNDVGMLQDANYHDTSYSNYTSPYSGSQQVNEFPNDCLQAEGPYIAYPMEKISDLNYYIGERKFPIQTTNNSMNSRDSFMPSGHVNCNASYNMSNEMLTHCNTGMQNPNYEHNLCIFPRKPDVFQYNHGLIGNCGMQGNDYRSSHPFNCNQPHRSRAVLPNENPQKNFRKKNTFLTRTPQMPYVHNPVHSFNGKQRAGWNPKIPVMSVSFDETRASETSVYMQSVVVQHKTVNKSSFEGIKKNKSENVKREPAHLTKLCQNTSAQKSLAVEQSENGSSFDSNVMRDDSETEVTNSVGKADKKIINNSKISDNILHPCVSVIDDKTHEIQLTAEKFSSIESLNIDKENLENGKIHEHPPNFKSSLSVEADVSSHLCGESVSSEQTTTEMVLDELTGKFKYVNTSLETLQSPKLKSDSVQKVPETPILVNDTRKPTTENLRTTETYGRIDDTVSNCKIDLNVKERIQYPLVTLSPLKMTKELENMIDDYITKNSTSIFNSSWLPLMQSPTFSETTPSVSPRTTPALSNLSPPLLSPIPPLTMYERTLNEKQSTSDNYRTKRKIERKAKTLTGILPSRQYEREKTLFATAETFLGEDFQNKSSRKRKKTEMVDTNNKKIEFERKDQLKADMEEVEILKEAEVANADFDTPFEEKWTKVKRSDVNTNIPSSEKTKEDYDLTKIASESKREAFNKKQVPLERESDVEESPLVQRLLRKSSKMLNDIDDTEKKTKQCVNMEKSGKRNDHEICPCSGKVEQVKLKDGENSVSSKKSKKKKKFTNSRKCCPENQCECKDKCLTLSDRKDKRKNHKKRSKESAKPKQCNDKTKMSEIEDVNSGSKSSIPEKAVTAHELELASGERNGHLSAATLELKTKEQKNDHLKQNKKAPYLKSKTGTVPGKEEKNISKDKKNTSRTIGNGEFCKNTTKKDDFSSSLDTSIKDNAGVEKCDAVCKTLTMGIDEPENKELKTRGMKKKHKRSKKKVDIRIHPLELETRNMPSFDKSLHREEIDSLKDLQASDEVTGTCKENTKVSRKSENKKGSSIQRKEKNTRRKQRNIKSTASADKESQDDLKSQAESKALNTGVDKKPEKADCSISGMHESSLNKEKRKLKLDGTDNHLECTETPCKSHRKNKQAKRKKKTKKSNKNKKAEVASVAFINDVDENVETNDKNAENEERFGPKEKVSERLKSYGSRKAFVTAKAIVKAGVKKLTKNDDPQLKCWFCNEHLSTRTLLTAHILSCHPYRCTWCKAEFDSRETSKEHYFTHMKSLYTCRMCNVRYGNPNTFQQHLSSKKHRQMLEKDIGPKTDGQNLAENDQQRSSEAQLSGQKCIFETENLDKPVKQQMPADTVANFYSSLQQNSQASWCNFKVSNNIVELKYNQQYDDVYGDYGNRPVAYSNMMTDFADQNGNLGYSLNGPGSKQQYDLGEQCGDQNVIDDDATVVVENGKVYTTMTDVKMPKSENIDHPLIDDNHGYTEMTNEDYGKIEQDTELTSLCRIANSFSLSSCPENEKM